MVDPQKILVVQTAFSGDVILTLPLVQVAKKVFPEARIDVVCVPRTAPVLHNHPVITNIIEFDKRGKDTGIGGLRRLSHRLKQERYDVALIPHRSLRSALLATLAKIPVRIGYDISAGAWFFTKRVHYKREDHEIERNIALLTALNVRWNERELPELYPSDADRRIVDALLRDIPAEKRSSVVAIAPGTVWYTKRWLKERFAELACRLVDDGVTVVLIGGNEDRQLCEEIRRMELLSRLQRSSAGNPADIINTAGKLSFLQSAELLRRCRLLVCNDSAPMHLAVAMRTPVVAIFGPTVPEFGFAPYGEHDVVVETKGLECRPCSIHGGRKCPIRTFVCMKDITAERVYEEVKALMHLSRPERDLPRRGCEFIS